VPMREECKHFQSRTYQTGEVVRFCELDLAPEAPWRCPENCPSYARRVADVGWVHGSLVEPAIEDEPGPGGPDVVRMLEEASDIVDAVVPQTLAEVEREESAAKRTRRGSGAPGAPRRRWPWRRS
jgi:hypothetical protein